MNRTFSSFLIAIIVWTLQIQAQTIQGKVVSVKDGDTIELRTDSSTVRIRFAQIDCPESSQAFGTKAKQFTSEMCFGKTVSVKTSGTDKYGRTIGEVILPDGRSLNRELVSAGFAWWYRQYSTDHTIGDLESAARSAKLGLWADANPTPPWEYRKGGQRQTKEPVTSGTQDITVESKTEYVPATPQEPIKMKVVTGTFVGNSNSKKFHLGTCTSAQKIAESNRVEFKSADDAVKAGYVGCKVCNPSK